MSEISARRLYRIVGIWDLILTLPFALPVLSGITIGALARIHLIIVGPTDFPEFQGLHLFFVQLFGVLAVMWAILRIHRPYRLLATYDTFGRLAVAYLMLTYTLRGGSPVPALFCVSELGWGLAQAICLIRTSRSDKRQE